MSRNEITGPNIHSPARSYRQWALLIAPLAVLFVAAWGFVLQLDLTGADIWTIFARAQDVLDQPSRLLDKYLDTYWEGAKFWRPGIEAVAAIEWKFFGDNAFPYHLLRLAVFFFTTLLVARAAAFTPAGRKSAWFAAGAIYMLHPLQIETIPAVARDADTFAAVLMAITLVALAQAREARTCLPLLIGTAAAVLAPTFKEPALLTPILGMVLLEPWKTKDVGIRRAIGGTIVLGAAIGGHVIYRFLLLGTLGGYESTRITLARSNTALEIFYSLFRHQGHKIPMLLALIAFGMALIFGGIIHRRVQSSPPTWRRIQLASWAWIAMGFVGVTFSQRYRSRYAEILLIPLAILIAGWLARLVAQAMDQRENARRLPMTAAASLLVGLLLAFGPGTPLVYSYPQWEVAATVGRDTLESLGECIQAARQTRKGTRIDLGRFAVAAQPTGRGGIVSIAIDPFPKRVAQHEGTFAGMIPTVVILGPQSIRGFVSARKLQPVQQLHDGTMILDVRPGDSKR